METFDDLDRGVVAQLGYAVARAQLLEFAMAKLLEVQRHDIARPLDERWDEISRWLDMTAGQLARELDLPEAVAQDLRALVKRRNRVAHEMWLQYITAREVQGESAAQDWERALSDESDFLGRAHNAVYALRDMTRDAKEVLEREAVALWRRHLPLPVTTP